MADAPVRLRVDVRGLGGVQSRVAGLPDAMQRSILRGALRAAAQVYRKEMRQRAPVSKEKRLDYTGRAPHRPGELRRSVRVGRVFVRAGDLRTTVKAGSRAAFYADIVEGGAKPHAIARKRRGGALAIGGRYVRGPVKHPGFAGRLFARAALQASEARATSAFQQYVDARLTRYWQTGR